MPRPISIVIAAAAVVLTAPVAAQMHEGSRGGGGFHGGSGARGGGTPMRGGGSPMRGAATPMRGSVEGAREGSVGARPTASQLEFHGRSFSTLSTDERAHWATGEWRHAMHDGVYGWWWFLDDDWFFYPDAIYPYPTYIAPLLTVQETPATPPSEPYWYYCANPQGYYPYVEACPTGWQTVPAAPADAPSGAPPPPPAQ